MSEFIINQTFYLWQEGDNWLAATTMLSRAVCSKGSTPTEAIKGREFKIASVPMRGDYWKATKHPSGKWYLESSKGFTDTVFELDKRLQMETVL